MTDPVLARLRDRILSAAADRTPLAPVGGATKAFYGDRPPSGAPAPLPLPLGELAGIVAYEPSELVVVARAGTPLAELEATLAEKGQMLGFEPPHFGAGATVGGCVAAGLSGPRRMAAGAVRDFVLGTKLLDARGRLLSFGGQVMKNVAGYDVARLLAGSLGTLGVIAEVSLKVLPRPAAEATLALPMGEAEALAAFDRWAGRPLPISAAAWVDGTARVRLSGARAAVDAALRELGRGAAAEPADVADAWWASLREQSHPFFTAPVAPGAALWRLALPAKVPPLAVPGAGATLVEWGGAQRWVRTTAGADAIRAIAAGAGGHATRFRAAAERRRARCGARVHAGPARAGRDRARPEAGVRSGRPVQPRATAPAGLTRGDARPLSAPGVAARHRTTGHPRAGRHAATARARRGRETPWKPI